MLHKKYRVIKSEDGESNTRVDNAKNRRSSFLHDWIGLDDYSSYERESPNSSIDSLGTGTEVALRNRMRLELFLNRERPGGGSAPPRYRCPIGNRCTVREGLFPRPRTRLSLGHSGLSDRSPRTCPLEIAAPPDGPIRTRRDYLLKEWLKFETVKKNSRGNCGSNPSFERAR